MINGRVLQMVLISSGTLLPAQMREDQPRTDGVGNAVVGPKRSIRAIHSSQNWIPSEPTRESRQSDDCMSSIQNHPISFKISTTAKPPMAQDMKRLAWDSTFQTHGFGFTRFNFRNSRGANSLVAVSCHLRLGQMLQLEQYQPWILETNNQTTIQTKWLIVRWREKRQVKQISPSLIPTLQ